MEAAIIHLSVTGIRQTQDELTLLQPISGEQMPGDAILKHRFHRPVQVAACIVWCNLPPTRVALAHVRHKGI